MNTRGHCDKQNLIEKGKSEKSVGRKCQKMRRYRANIQKDPERLSKMREKDRERKRVARAKQREEVIKGNRTLDDQLREKKREQMRAYRAKKKQEKDNAKIELSPEVHTSLKRRAEKLRKKKAVQRTKQWRLRVKMGKNIPLTDTPNENTNIEKADEEGKRHTESPGYSRWSLYRGAKKARLSLPTSPERRAAIVEKLAESPTTAKILQKKGKIITSEIGKKLEMAESVYKEISSNLNENKKKQNTDRKTATHALLYTTAKAVGRKYKMAGSSLNIPKWKLMDVKKKKADWWKPSPRKKRKDALSEIIRQKVRDFYLSQEISREVPNKKEVICLKEGKAKEYVQRHVMIMTTADAFHIFKTENADIKIGLSSFKKIKPKQVRRLSETSRKSCLCQTCCNVALKIEALKVFIKASKEKINACDIDPNKSVLAELTMCDVKIDGRHDPKCLNRECEKCGTKLLQNYLEPLRKQCQNQNINISWHRWENLKVDRDDGSKKVIKSCVPRNTTFDNFIKELEDDIYGYPSHKFRAVWQQQKMMESLKTLNKNELMMIMDFSENYKCSFQNEIQSAYFDQNLVTIHPVMCYYKKELNNEEYLYKHSVICISNDLKHDSSLVKEFENKTLENVKEQIEVELVKQWTDGCAGQYKCKTAFAYLSSRTTSMSRQYFETSHGKNVCDGLGAIVKNSCYRAMLTGKVIGTANDVYSHCSRVLGHGPKVNEKDKIVTIRQFAYIDRNSVDHENIPAAKTLIGTRKIHAIRSTDVQLVVESRNLSCFCHGCLHNTACENSTFIDPWTLSDLNPNPVKQRPTQKTKKRTSKATPCAKKVPCFEKRMIASKPKAVY